MIVIHFRQEKRQPKNITSFINETLEKKGFNTIDPTAAEIMFWDMVELVKLNPSLLDEIKELGVSGC